jgi:predicted DNA binding protein
MAAIQQVRPIRRAFAGRGPVSPPRPRPARVVNSAGRLLSCRVKVTLPPACWLRVLTAPHPEYRVEVLSRQSPEAGRTVTAVRLHGPREPDWQSELEQLPGVDRVDILEEDSQSVLLQVSHLTPAWAAVAERLDLLWRYPFWAGEGEARWSIVGPEEKVRAYLSEIRPTVEAVRVEAIVRGTRDKPIDRLSPRQRELVQRAVSAGYFEVPRRVSLTELAERLQLAKSTLSERLAVIERKLIAEAVELLALAGPRPPEEEPLLEPVRSAAPTAPVPPWGSRVPSVEPVLLTVPGAV